MMLMLMMMAVVMGMLAGDKWNYIPLKNLIEGGINVPLHDIQPEQTRPENGRLDWASERTSRTMQEVVVDGG